MAGKGAVISISSQVIFIATILISAIGLLWQANTYATVSSEAFNVSTYPATISLAHTDLVSGSLVVYNATWNPVDTANNYSVAVATGIITTTSPSNMTNNTVFYANYNYGEWDVIIVTILKSVMGIIILIVAIMLILAEVGYKVKF